jgi:hypothetical protein
MAVVDDNELHDLALHIGHTGKSWEPPPFRSLNRRFYCANTSGRDQRGGMPKVLPRYFPEMKTSTLLESRLSTPLLPAKTPTFYANRIA